MGLTALDYSSAISAADLAAAGIDTVFRYITDPAWDKSLQADEYADLTAHGIRVVLLDEGLADYMVTGSYAGFAGGATRARQRRARAREIGAGGEIFYSLDIGATEAQIDTALEFLAGAHSVDPGGVGAYGEYDFVRKAADSGYPIFGTEGWSKGQRDPRAIAWQLARQTTIAGVRCDVVELNPSTLHPTTPEDDMPAFSEGQINTGTGAQTVISLPPANYGSAGWGDVWFSMGSAWGDAHVEVGIYVHGKGWEQLSDDFLVPDLGDRANPFGGPLPQAVQKVSIRRKADGAKAALSYLIEAAAR